MKHQNWLDLLGWHPSQLEELRFAGFSYLKEGQYEMALRFFRALVILDPTSLYDHQTLGALYLEIGNKEEALKTIDHALSLDPAHEPTQLNRVKALLLHGRRQEALRLARRLETSKSLAISQDASALLTAYR